MTPLKVCSGLIANAFNWPDVGWKPVRTGIVMGSEVGNLEQRNDATAVDNPSNNDLDVCLT